ncbi:MAG: hypothetical protein IPH06_13695 [Alphaproteobacteria bacterium]|nr:hypothetical protein [Alphaproteobacteria bacterium]
MFAGPKRAVDVAFGGRHLRQGDVRHPPNTGAVYPRARKDHDLHGASSFVRAGPDCSSVPQRREAGYCSGPDRR